MKSMIANSITFASTLFFGALVLAAAPGHGPVEVPVAVYHQAFNITLVLLGIIYFTRTAIIALFKTRREDYLAQAEKSKRLREEAQANLRDIESRLSVLENTKLQSLKKAEIDAEELRAQLLQEANAQAERIRFESKAASSAEIERAKVGLLLQMTEEALNGAQQILSKDISGADQGRLQENFVQQL